MLSALLKLGVDESLRLNTQLREQRPTHSKAACEHAGQFDFECTSYWSSRRGQPQLTLQVLVHPLIVMSRNKSFSIGTNASIALSLSDLRARNPFILSQPFRSLRLGMEPQTSHNQASSGAMYLGAATSNLSPTRRGTRSHRTRSVAAKLFPGFSPESDANIWLSCAAATSVRNAARPQEPVIPSAAGVFFLAETRAIPARKALIGPKLQPISRRARREA
jgi:hypothetical protein